MWPCRALPRGRCTLSPPRRRAGRVRSGDGLDRRTGGSTDVRRAVANHDGRMKPKQVRISATCSLPPELVLAAACDFSARRAEIWPNVPAKLMTVHAVGRASADVTEGTRKGLL